jgi:hypothetical protein
MCSALRTFKATACTSEVATIRGPFCCDDQLRRRGHAAVHVDIGGLHKVDLRGVQTGGGDRLPVASKPLTQI